MVRGLFNLSCFLCFFVALMAEYKSMERGLCICLPASDFKEILHHLNLAELKTRLFCGRKAQLASVKTYLSEKQWSSPLMIGGASGGGKWSDCVHYMVTGGWKFD